MLFRLRENLPTGGLCRIILKANLNQPPILYPSGRAAHSDSA